MAKRSAIVEMTSYGIYSQWDSKSKHLPKIKEFTTKVPADQDIEFGFIVNIKKAKGQVIEYCIEHPGVLGKKAKCWTLLQVIFTLETTTGISI